ncbi:hypothetical protein ACIPVK_21720 [Paeniglutamicibacter sp. MACA_103]|uniref:hypothetical protein n=1 Tax=Paeniglutamicibacter sp. MACA_103 TaxID=3377337 RepID=UPI0038947F97
MGEYSIVAGINGSATSAANSSDPRMHVVHNVVDGFVSSLYRLSQYRADVAHPIRVAAVAREVRGKVGPVPAIGGFQEFG